LCDDFHLVIPFVFPALKDVSGLVPFECMRNIFCIRSFGLVYLLPRGT
jgi:hypothetical protein